jgi:UDP-N-acetylglucosamine 2-epimerase (non-hydrolysing)
MAKALPNARRPRRTAAPKSRKKLVCHIVGARPNYMKIAPVYAALARGGEVEQRLIHTGQHYDRNVNEIFFAELPLPAPDVQLEVGSGSHGVQTAKALVGLEEVFDELRPDLVIVPGDVNSSLAGALAAAKLQIPVCHLESGLRSFDWTMPEEHNRRLTDHLSTLLVTHSEDAIDNLLNEGVPSELIVFAGNTMIDTLLENVKFARASEAWRDFGLEERDYILVTLHRPALVDSGPLLGETMHALAQVSESYPVVFPVHPRTRARISELGIEPGGRVQLVAPQSYTRFLALQAGAAAVVTDSGGVQEETTALGVPCFTLRDNTERPVTITHGTNQLLGLHPRRLREIPDLLRRPRRGVVPPLWDGLAGERCAREIERVVLEGVPACANRAPANGGSAVARRFTLVHRPLAD